MENEIVDAIQKKNQNRMEALKYNNSGFAKYRSVNFDDAISDYTKAIEIDPDLSVAYYNRGTVLYRLGLYNLALADLTKAVHLDSTNIEFKKGLRECQQFSTLNQ